MLGIKLKSSGEKKQKINELIYFYLYEYFVCIYTYAQWPLLVSAKARPGLGSLITIFIDGNNYHICAVNWTKVFCKNNKFLLLLKQLSIIQPFTVYLKSFQGLFGWVGLIVIVPLCTLNSFCISWHGSWILHLHSIPSLTRKSSFMLSSVLITVLTEKHPWPQLVDEFT